uniref:Uncharacterized protein n=2 Tax=Nothobranchius furzeri TaxID=105023 RepID=A0A1A8B898_NOTFU
MQESFQLLNVLAACIREKNKSSKPPGGVNDVCHPLPSYFYYSINLIKCSECQSKETRRARPVYDAAGSWSLTLMSQCRPDVCLVESNQRATGGSGKSGTWLGRWRFLLYSSLLLLRNSDEFTCLLLNQHINKF